MRSRCFALARLAVWLTVITVYIGARSDSWGEGLEGAAVAIVIGLGVGLIWRDLRRRRTDS
jgi:ABC-type nickel/cobalt efflux system permease component RcnA